MRKSIERALARRRLWYGEVAPEPTSRIINSYGSAPGERVPCIRSLRRVIRYSVKKDMYPLPKSKAYCMCGSSRIARERRALIQNLNLEV